MLNGKRPYFRLTYVAQKRLCLSSLICLNATKFVIVSVFTLLETICPKMWAKGLSSNAGSPLPVDVFRSKTPNNF